MFAKIERTIHTSGFPILAPSSMIPPARSPFLSSRYCGSTFW
jgi:hypothetical protein